jgi:mycofactocin precursor
MTDHPAPGRPATTTDSTGTTDATAPETAEAAPSDVYEAEVLVEEVSIDGMCGVY